MKMSNGTAPPTIKELLLDEVNFYISFKPLKRTYHLNILFIQKVSKRIFRNNKNNYNLRNKGLYLSYNDFNKECKWSYRDLYCSDALTNFVDESIRPLYKKLWNNLFKVKYFSEDFKSLPKEKKKICIYLKYWFYDQLLSKNISNDGIGKFFSAWESTSQGYKRDLIGCELYKMSLNEIKETKLLYDYFLLYDGYNNDELVSHKIYVSPYCQYLKEAADVYKKRKIECVSGNNIERCKEFKNYIKNYMIKNDITLFKGKCKNEEQRVERMDATETMFNPALKELVEKVHFIITMKK
ncbi:variable surface protein Vir21-related [Plasmodium vivax]|uniref:Variable surface protein Vir21-related n=1 Tax=Plasmodium vivax (strain Salvador I) TaxID=126793 RepID=A5KCL4_PLAVS|nr:variable surface protein Vir21-related [Plasmodium vivax]EDL42886.1 variable surface protein Vir21-related [Plasmodium vivax]|eukprot:XP_001612660.1 variable surface protein Vir21-related [Plasmodium vivax Sal-1]